MSDQLVFERRVVFHAEYPLLGRLLEGRNIFASDEVIEQKDQLLCAVQDWMQERCGHLLSDYHALSTNIVIAEVVTNGALHGNAYTPGTALAVRLAIREVLEGTCPCLHFSLCVEGVGEEFDPEKVVDPTALENLEKPIGRGLLLTRHYGWMLSQKPFPYGKAITYEATFPVFSTAEQAH